MSRNNYFMKLKVNSIASRFIKVNSHTAPESIAVHIIVFTIISWLTYLAYKAGESEFMYFGLVVAILFLVIVLADIYFIISTHLTKTKQSADDEAP